MTFDFEFLGWPDCGSAEHAFPASGRRHLLYRLGTSKSSKCYSKPIDSEQICRKRENERGREQQRRKI